MTALVTTLLTVISWGSLLQSTEGAILRIHHTTKLQAWVEEREGRRAIRYYCTIIAFRCRRTAAAAAAGKGRCVCLATCGAAEVVHDSRPLVAALVQPCLLLGGLL